VPPVLVIIRTGVRWRCRATTPEPRLDLTVQPVANCRRRRGRVPASIGGRRRDRATRHQAVVQARRTDSSQVAVRHVRFHLSIIGIAGDIFETDVTSR
jgi:hypothetical protein